MRLHRLSMRGIGPFSAPAEIDFSKLGESGLFLLEGPTGSGKSTIIDAISFALYGRVAQASSDAERLRSHHGDPSAEPVIELIFETQSGIYRVRRTPGYERPKRSGSGTSKVQGSVKLWRITSPDAPQTGEPLSTRVAEADDEILRAVGLNHAQFVQTIVLPQGEFANFLRSRTEDKKVLLQKLFGTELVARTQLHLIEARKTAEARRAQAAMAMTKAAEAFGVAAAEAPAEAASMSTRALEGDLTAIREHVRLRMAELEANLHLAEAAHGEANERLSAAQRTLAHARDLRRRQDRRAGLTRRRSELALEGPEFERRRLALSRAEQAAAVTPVAEALAAAIQRSNDAQDAAAQSRRGLAPEYADSDEPTLRRSAAELHATIGRLAEEVRREDELSVLLAEQERTTNENAALTRVRAAAELELSELPERIAQYETRRAVAAALSARAAELATEQERATVRLRSAKLAAEAAHAAEHDEQITQAALAAYEAQEQRLASLQLAWRASVAGQLGQALTIGDPCMVCGSLEHPRPAAPEPQDVSQADLESAASSVQRLRRNVEAARVQLMKQRAELTQLRYAADQLSPEQAQAKLGEVGAAVRSAHEATHECLRLDELLVDLRRRSEDLRERLGDAAVTQSRFAERLASLTASITHAQRMLHKARDGFDTVGARRDALIRTVRQLEAAATATSAAATAIADALDCGDRFQKTLAEAGFSDQAEWSAAQLSPVERTRLGTQLRTFDEAWIAIEHALAEAELTDPELDLPAPDLDSLAALVGLGEAGQAEAAKAMGSATSTVNAARRHARALEATIEDAVTVVAETAAAIRLGNLAAGLGDNQLKMELTTYVLIRRFGEIVSAANGQLRRISGGRYELVHSDARQGNTKSGLGLRVLDLHTGRSRDPGTLSGGETFYVALALALGLADVVRAESGGVELGTLFIDEGFGSLDPEVLDEVLDVLDALRAGGRAVGVVSHVPEMKARIADRITILPNPDGTSNLRVIV